MDASTPRNGPQPAARQAAGSLSTGTQPGPEPWWRRLGRRWPRRDARPVVALQPVGMAPRDLPALRRTLDDLGRMLGVRFDLDAPDAATVLLDIDYAGRTPVPLVKAQTLGRPAVLVETADGPDAASREAQRQELLRQLLALPALRHLTAPAGPAEAAPHAPQAGALQGEPGSSLSAAFDSAFDSVLQAEQLVGLTPDDAGKDLVARVLRGLHDDASPTLVAAYGPQAAMRFDFAARMVALDPLALQGLRVRRELPRLASAPTLTDHAVTHELDEIVWHLGMACGRYVLLGQPDDAWHAALVGHEVERIEPFTRQPRHLELMRRLQQGPATPSQLRRHVRIGVADLRGFLQACLFLGLLRWAGRNNADQNLV